MASFYEILQTEQNTVPNLNEAGTKGLEVFLNADKIIEVKENALVDRTSLLTMPQSWNGIPDARTIEGDFEDTWQDIQSLKGGPNTMVPFNFIAEGENYPSPGWTAQTWAVNTGNILSVEPYAGANRVSELNGGSTFTESDMSVLTVDAVVGSYADTPLTGGSGTGATGKVTVTNTIAGDEVTEVIIDEPDHKGYKEGDVLTISQTVIGGTVDVKFALRGGDITTNSYTVIRLNQYRDSLQVNYVVDASYEEAKIIVEGEAK